MILLWSCKTRQWSLSFWEVSIMKFIKKNLKDWFWCQFCCLLVFLRQSTVEIKPFLSVRPAPFRLECPGSLLRAARIAAGACALNPPSAPAESRCHWLGPSQLSVTFLRTVIGSRMATWLVRTNDMQQHLYWKSRGRGSLFPLDLPLGG